MLYDAYMNCKTCKTRKKYEPAFADARSILVSNVILEIEKCLRQEDYEAIDELLRFVPRENLINFLPEGEWKKYR